MSWLGSTSLALWSVIMVDIWHWVPVRVPDPVRRGRRPAARRARGGARRRRDALAVAARVTLPLLMPAITVAFLFRSILAFKAFDEVFLLTGGGPGTSSELVEPAPVQGVLRAEPARLRRACCRCSRSSACCRCWLLARSRRPQGG